MIKEMDEIKKILELSDGKKTSKNKTENMLKRICTHTLDGYFRHVVKYYEANTDKCIHLMEGICGNTAERCAKSKCKSCLINKWCGFYRDSCQKDEEKREGYTYADFFCGAGGLSIGFHQEGFRLSLANDIQKCCIETYSFNHPETPSNHIIAGDINDVITKLNKVKRFQKLDVVVGGPPCQGFSMANRQRMIDDPRNHLYKSFIAAVNKLAPKIIVMENVRGILNVEKEIKEDFEKIGFQVSARLLNAKDFGVPQNRERVIFIGNSIGLDNNRMFETLFDYAKKQKKRCLKDAIDDMQVLSAKTQYNKTALENEESGYTISRTGNRRTNEYIKSINNQKMNVLMYNHKARYNNARDIEIFSRLNPGDDSTDPKIQDIMPYKRRGRIFKDKYFKLEMDRPCKTITAHMKYDCNMYIHPHQARGLTPREAARIQSFPDDYYFRGAYTTVYMQVGNSVPPLLGRAIAKVVWQYLEGGIYGSI